MKSFSIDSHNGIILSQSHDIFENLALEDWLYTNYDLTSKDLSVLLMWYNGPSVVIGRHQNPWIECSVDFCNSNNINIARRNSGGGTVYHDFGNLNFSFLTPRIKYDRKKNLELICESIRTASKLGRNNAYHHCTVLVNVDQTKLRQSLFRNLKGVESKATSSLRAEVMNLKLLCPDIDTIKVIEAVSNYYKQLHGVENVFCVTPNEDLFPGINKIKSQLKCWEWCFGHTPRFSVTKSFQLFDKSRKPISKVEIMMNVNKAKIESISLNPQILKKENFNALSECIIKTPFTIEIHDSLAKWMHHCDDKIMCQIIKSYILEIIQDVCR
ncbi:lipoyltransferase 1, mitochondrial [Caerostris darwini]|uniref:Lipoyltransferase 1, mitochondrial n=1 Tax=Caerostris darwini TaxID=1538125 RepID=A0AAV4PQR3_9ARAC|nr:lipoyltransferase 1, mitochondrial [Caerostris darwini]